MPSRSIRLSGHLLDSLILARVLDEITAAGASYSIDGLAVGRRPARSSRAALTLRGRDANALDRLAARLARLGARPEALHDAALAPAPADGVFPEAFHATTNLPTRVRIAGRWLPVHDVEMDCAIRVTPDLRRAETVPFHRARRGDLIVTGDRGVDTAPLERARGPGIFRFMGGAVSPERPRAGAVAGVARELRRARAAGGRILVVAGPVVVHTGGAPDLARLIRAGYVQVLFAGNGLATHDLEAAMYGTALGAPLASPNGTRPDPGGHAAHLRAINAIRRCGGIAAAVREGLVPRGILHACVTRGVPFVLAGSIRDDGPLPDVITDSVRAQDAMRRHVPGVTVALLIGSTLHAIAAGNLLPATVRTVCVDVNPAVVTKLADRGTFQGVGIVADAASFLHELCAALRLRG